MDPVLRQMALQQQMQNDNNIQEMPHPSYMEFMRSNNASPVQEQVTPEENSPISKGTLSAIKAAKRSLGMDEEEKRRAMGLAIMKFFSNLAKPGHGPGFAGALGAVNDSFNPAMEAYLNERNRVEDVNAAMMKQLMDAEAEQKRQLHQERQLTEMARHNKAQERLASQQNYLQYGSKNLERKEKISQEIENSYIDEENEVNKYLKTQELENPRVGRSFRGPSDQEKHAVQAIRERYNQRRKNLKTRLQGFEHQETPQYDFSNTSDAELERIVNE